MKNFKFQNSGFDHVEFILKDVSSQSTIYEKWGSKRSESATFRIRL